MLYSSDIGGKGGGGAINNYGGNGLAVYSYNKIANSKMYTYSGNYTKVFPDSYSDIAVHAWGAGGAGSVSDGTTSCGDGGGYVKCTVSLPYDQTLYLTVGGGGRVGKTYNTISRDAYGGGGR
jgi:hypothetical protein